MTPIDSPAVRLVTFDLGGVLVRITRTWEEACALAGVPVHPATDSPEAWRARQPYIHAYERGELGYEAFLEGLAVASGGHYAAAEIERIHHVILREEFPGIDRLLGDLEAAEVATAILSNTNASHWDAVFSPTGRERFPSVARVGVPMASHLLRARKPDAEIFARADAVTGIRGAEVLYFDDLEDNVKAARRAGWRSERVDPTGDPAAEMRAHLVAARVLA